MSVDGDAIRNVQATSREVVAHLIHTWIGDPDEMIDALDAMVKLLRLDRESDQHCLWGHTVSNESFIARQEMRRDLFKQMFPKEG